MRPPDPLILTAAVDPHATAAFQTLRDRHFPPERNIVPAHLSMFHHLPGVELRAVLDDLRATAVGVTPIRFATGPPRFLGRGCALPIAAPDLLRLHAELARRWAGWLTPQDRQPFHPHVTVQNKVAPEEARRLCAALAGMAPVSGAIVGVEVWAYVGGPWRHLAHVGFDVVAG